MRFLANHGGIVVVEAKQIGAIRLQVHPGVYLIKNWRALENLAKTIVLFHLLLDVVVLDDPAVIRKKVRVVFLGQVVEPIARSMALILQRDDQLDYFGIDVII